MKHTTLNCVVVGDGAWGTSLALVLHRNKHRVQVWGAFEDNVEQVNRTHSNARFLPGVDIPPDLPFTTDISAAANADMLILGTPSQYLRGPLQALAELKRPKHQIVVNISKGIETGTLLRMSELCHSFLGPVHFAQLSGPSHAEEVSRGVPTLVVAASHDTKTAAGVQSAFMSDTFRVYTSHDVLGVELGGALKNVYAIAAGVIDGIGLGDNTKAALMTRGIAEMARLGKALGGQARTFSGLSGVGDLIVTCMSRHSRNRFVGEELGKGRLLSDIVRSMNMVVAEGVKTAEAAFMLAERTKIDTPIIRGIYELLYKNRSPKEIVSELMTRKAKHEND